MQRPGPLFQRCCDGKASEPGPLMPSVFQDAEICPSVANDFLIACVFRMHFSIMHFALDESSQTTSLS